MRLALLFILYAFNSTAMVIVPDALDLTKSAKPKLLDEMTNRTTIYSVPLQRCLAFFIDAEWLVTAEHCIDSYNVPNVLIVEGKKPFLALELRYPDPSVDIAVLRLEKPLTKDMSDKLGTFENNAGSTYFSVGVEWGNPSYVYDETNRQIGSVYSITWDPAFPWSYDVQNTLYIEASTKSKDFPMTGNFYVQPGDSGGPLLNSKGQVIGVLSRVQHLDKDGQEIIQSHWSPLSKDVVQWIRWVQKSFADAQKASESVIKQAVKDRDWIKAATLVDPNKKTRIPYGPNQSMTIDTRGRSNTSIEFSSVGSIKFYNSDVNQVIKHVLLQSDAPVDEGGAFCSVFPCRRLRFAKSHDVVTVYTSDVPKLMKVFTR